MFNGTVVVKDTASGTSSTNDPIGNSTTIRSLNNTVVFTVTKGEVVAAITARVIEGFQAKRRLEGASNRAVNMDVGALRQVMKRFKQWRRLEDDVKMLTESGGEPIGRVLTNEEQEGLLKVTELSRAGAARK